MSVKTNELKKGTRVQLRNGWYATIADNARGTIRMCDVEGICREIGSVYAHDILRAQLPTSGGYSPVWAEVEHTDAQNKLRKQVGAL